MRLDKLVDWSKHPAEAIKYFSGTATYRKTFDCLLLTAHSPLFLSLSEFKGIAEVHLNGKNLGTIWCAPWQVEITNALKPGKNELEIRMANCWPNRLIGDEKLPADAEFELNPLGGGMLKSWPKWLLDKNTPRTSGRRTFSTYKHWVGNEPLQPSGLLGPVRVMGPGCAVVSPPVDVPLWPQARMPGSPVVEPKGLTVHQRNWKYTHVPVPGMTIFRPTTAKDGEACPALPAMVVCPGGGYGVLAWAKEGTEVAEWLNSIGVVAVVLKYRVPNCREGALQDLQRAVRLIRHQAADWNIDARRLGVIGFSAGGDLCVRLCALGDRDAYPALDEADKESSRPQFAMLVYPAFYDHKGRVDKGGMVEQDLMPTALTPPTFIVHTEDDVSFVNGTKTYVKGLEAVGVKHRFLLFPAGGHGYGLRLRDKNDDLKRWPEQAARWLWALGRAME